MSMHCISSHRPPTSSCLTPIPISGADERVASRRPESSPHIPTLPGREIHDRADGQGRAQFALHIGFALIRPVQQAFTFLELVRAGDERALYQWSPLEEIAQALGQGQDPTSSRSAERTGRRDGAQAKKQQRVPSRRHVRICTGEETERRVSMSNIYDIVINMPADPPAGLEGVRWCIGKVTVAPELHEELSRRLSHAFDFITGGGHRVQFIQWGTSTLLTAGLSRLQVVAGRLDRHTASFPAAHELQGNPLRQ